LLAELVEMLGPSGVLGLGKGQGLPGLLRGYLGVLESRLALSERGFTLGQLGFTLSQLGGAPVEVLQRAGCTAAAPFEFLADPLNLGGQLGLRAAKTLAMRGKKGLRPAPLRTNRLGEIILPAGFKGNRISRIFHGRRSAESNDAGKSAQTASAPPAPRLRREGIGVHPYIPIGHTV
jgi:hypothetical protein